MMHRTLFFITVMLLTHTVIGQSLTVGELIKVYNSNNSDAETIILSKGYEFIEADTTDISSYVMFSYKPSESNRQYSDYVVFIMDYNFGGRGVSFQTKKKDYLAAKRYCTQHGYKFISTENKKGSIVSTYRNQNWEIELESFKNSTQDGLEITSYFIKLTKP